MHRAVSAKMRHGSASISSILLQRGEPAAVILLLLIALLLRTVHLESLPAGFHGDEAVVGLEAQRILDEGHIGVYSSDAAGQPTGPMYLVAGSVWLFGNTVFAVRIVPALLGTLTVFALYVVLRRNFGIPAALVGASVLAVMNWHIHFARVGFPIEAWPLVVVLIAGAVTEALRSADWRWWAVTGALGGAGVYVYNAHLLLGATICLTILGVLVVSLRDTIRRHGIGIAIGLLSCLLVLLPMLDFMMSEDSFYWRHFEKARITESDEWREREGLPEQATFLVASYRDTWDALCCDPELDAVDGTGLTVIIPPLMLLVAGTGMLTGFWRYRGFPVVLGTVIVLVMPLAPALSGGGELRRSLVIAPFLAMFCGLAYAGLADAARGWGGRRIAYPAVAVLGMVHAGIAYQNLDLYFDDFAEPEVQERIMGKPITDAAKFLDEQPANTYVYFFSDKWSIDYVTMEYLAPNVEGEDRSRRFGDFHILNSSREGRPLYVFLDPYLATVEDIGRIYPGRVVGPPHDGSKPSFLAFVPLVSSDTSDQTRLPTECGSCSPRPGHH